MRAPLLLLAGALILAGCGPLPPVVYVPEPDNGTVAEERYAAPPVGITIARADERRVLVSTNQPAYIAVFEIIPGRGATLLYPRSTRQFATEVNGSRWVDVTWRRDDDDRGGRRFGRGPTERYIYALASDRPLRHSDRALDDDYIDDLVGMNAARSRDPHEMKERLSWHFLPAMLDEDWGEDLYLFDIRANAPTRRVARVYCPDGSVTYVLDDYASRASCPPRGRVRGGGRVAGAPPAPDSVIAWTGKPIVRRAEKVSRPPVYRVPKPVVAERPAPSPTDDRPRRGNGDDDDDRDRGRDRGNNGNHGNGNNGNGGGNGNDGNNGNHGNGNNGNGNGNGGGNGSNAGGNGEGNNGNGNGNGGGNGSNAGGNGNGRGRGIVLQGKPQPQPEPVTSSPMRPERKPVTEPVAAPPAVQPAAPAPAPGKGWLRDRVTPAEPPAAQPKREVAPEPAAEPRKEKPRPRSESPADSTDEGKKKSKP